MEGAGVRMGGVPGERIMSFRWILFSKVVEACSTHSTSFLKADMDRDRVRPRRGTVEERGVGGEEVDPSKDRSRDRLHP